MCCYIIVFFTYMLLIFSDINKTQVYKLPYRESPRHEIRIVISFYYKKCLIQMITKTIIKRQKIKTFFFEIGDKKPSHVGYRVLPFETNDKTVNNTSNVGCKDNNFPFGYIEKNINLMLHRK